MTGENEYEDENINLEANSNSTNITTSSCNTQLLEVTIKDAKNKKKTMSSTMDSVINLMREVEHREKVAQQAVENIGKSSLDVLAKVEQLKHEQITASETNQKCAKDVYAQRDVLAAEMDALQISVARLLNIGDSFVGVLDEIQRALEIRLLTALTKKEEAENENLKKELSAQTTLAFEERQMEKVVQEAARLKREAMKNSKMQEVLTHHGHEVNTLREEIISKHQDLNRLILKLGFPIALCDILSSNQKHYEPQSDIKDSTSASKRA